MGAEDRGKVAYDSSNPVSWREMFHTAAAAAAAPPPEATATFHANSERGRVDSVIGVESMKRDTLLQLTGSANMQLALAIAMAHAGLLLVVLTLYGSVQLLKDFWKPIQWALLGSMALREVQQALVKFWETPLQSGIVQTLLAIPIAVCNALKDTYLDLKVALFSFLGKKQGRPFRVNFLKLFQWLVSFAAFVLGYDLLGLHNLAILAFAGVLGSAAATIAAHFFAPRAHTVSSKTSPSSSDHNSSHSRSSKLRVLNQNLTRFLLLRLPTGIAISLIIFMILGFVSTLILFSYKIGMEGKDAVISMKDHVQKGSYSDKIGLKQWVEQSRIPELLDTYALKAYETVSQQIDEFALKYDLTELADAGKEFLIRFAQSSWRGVNPTSATKFEYSHPLIVKLQIVFQHLKNYDFQGIYSELENTLLLLSDHLHISREEVLGKMKDWTKQGSEVAKGIFFSGTSFFGNCTSLVLWIVALITSGAAGFFHFLAQAAVFFSLLYYLITSESGGVMGQILGMIPLSNSTRLRCATVLDHAVSSVLLATVKSAFFDSTFTWLLFKFFNIHFLYVSTLLSLLSAVLPLVPSWLPSLLGTFQLVVEGHYIQGFLLVAVHLWVIDYGNTAIQNEIPGHNAYLTGLSIAGGMALFTPALEGAIMGPLLMTVLIALKNLYTEFVLNIGGNQ